MEKYKLAAEGLSTFAAVTLSRTKQNESIQALSAITKPMSTTGGVQYGKAVL
jgi:hypothetical protein